MHEHMHGRMEANSHWAERRAFAGPQARILRVAEVRDRVAALWLVARAGVRGARDVVVAAEACVRRDRRRGLWSHRAEGRAAALLQALVLRVAEMWDHIAALGGIARRCIRGARNVVVAAKAHILSHLAACTLDLHSRRLGLGL